MKKSIAFACVSVFLLVYFIMPSCFLFVKANEIEIIAPDEAKVLEDINNRLILGGVKHPYIHGSREVIEKIKLHISEDEEYSTKLYESVKKKADELLNTPAISHGGAVSQGHTAVQSRILTLMTVYFISGEETYLNRAMDEFAALQSITTWTAAAQLDNTQTAAAIAICYDWLYDYLSAEQKKWAVTSIKEKSVDIAYEYYKDPSKLDELRAENENMNIWCWRGSYNHITYNNSNLLICALAIAPEYPEYSAFVISKNMYNIQPYLEMVGDGGGHEEPVGYFGYTTGKIVNMLSALQSSLGTMYGYEKYPGFESTAYYPLYMYGAGPFAFGDCSPSKAEFDTNFLYFTAKYAQNKSLMALLSERFLSGDCINPLLWYEKGELDGAESEKLTFDRILSPVSKKQNVASFRSSWDIDKGFFAAMYAGCATSNGHADAVSGAFCIDAYGERFVTPIGMGSYNYAGYWDNVQEGKRWNWYEKRPEGNNCLVINPSEKVGQDVTANAFINYYDFGDGGSYAITDLTDVYQGYVKSYKRGMKICDERSRIVIQDEAVMNEPSEIFWSFNTPAEIEILNYKTALLTINNKQMLVRISANIDFHLFIMKAEKLDTSPTVSGQRTFPAYRKLALSAENVTGLNLMAEFIPLPTPYDKNRAPLEFESMSQWHADDTLDRNPALDMVYINGEAIEEFERGIYSYNLQYERLSDELLRITYDNSEGNNVNISFTKTGALKAIIEVSNGERQAWYEIVISQKPPESSETGKTKVTRKSFTSAIYNPSNAEDLGNTNSGGKGWVPHIYAGGVWREYYCTVDISSLSDKLVMSAVYNLYCGGDINISMYSLSGDFTPGVTPYNSLPQSEGFIASFDKNMGKGGYAEIDITSHLQKLLSEGKSKLCFVIIQNDASTTVLANENTYSEWYPSISVEYKPLGEAVEISDFDITSFGDEQNIEISVTNNRDVCLGDYTLIAVSYLDTQISDVKVCKSGRIMPYRSKELSVNLKAAENIKLYLWDISEGLISKKTHG